MLAFAFAFEAWYPGQPGGQRSPPAKEYVAVPDELLADTETLRPYMDLTYHHVLSLKPKPVKKSGKSAVRDPPSNDPEPLGIPLVPAGLAPATVRRPPG